VRRAHPSGLLISCTRTPSHHNEIPAEQNAGDYNTAADRHLRAAALPRLRPDLLISESTYATTLRDSKKTRERELIAEVRWGLFRALEPAVDDHSNSTNSTAKAIG
jgi:hypothetical protein